MSTSPVLVLLYLILGNVKSSGNSTKFFIGNDSKFYNLAVDKTHGWVFIGGLNHLYQLNNTLDLITSYEIGPKLDSVDCPIQGVCVTNVTRNLTNNHNKALVIDYSHENPRLISCGSVFQGLCHIHKNINNISAQVEMVNQSVVANDETSSTLAFIGPGPSISSSPFVLYVAATFTDNSIYRYEVPMVASRSLNENSMLKIAEENFDSGTKIMLFREYKYFVNYVYGFSSGLFTYFLSTQPNSSVLSPQSYTISKLIRICNKDSKYYSYTEIPIKCTRENGQDYNLAQAAYVTKVEAKYAKFFGMNNSTSEDLEVLFVAFSQSKNREGDGSTTPSKFSALCVYSLANVNRKFIENIQNCLNTGGYRGLGFITPQVNSCFKSPNLTITEDFCSTDFDTQLDGNIPVVGMPLITYNSTLITAITATCVDNRIIVFLGTSDGCLKKISLENFTTVVELDDFIIDETPVNRNLLFDSQMAHLFVMTRNKLTKIKVSDCDIYTTCGDCLKKTYSCGWCFLQNKCTQKTNCHQKSNDNSSWIDSGNGQCPLIGSVKPTLLQYNVCTRLEIIIKNLPLFARNNPLYCVFNFSNGSLVTNASLNDQVIACSTPESYLLPTLTLDNHYLTTKLSIKTNTSLEFISTSLRFIDCEIFTSCKTCISLQYPCKWSLINYRCFYDMVENSECGIFSLNSTDDHFHVKENHTGVRYCPDIRSMDNENGEILIPAGTRKRLKFRSPNVPPLLNTETFSCRFILEGRTIKTSAILKRPDNVILCDEIEFNYTQQAPTFLVNFEILYGAGWRPLDNPDNIRLIMYKCNEMAINCGLCLNVKPTYKCGWCENRNQCVIFDHCQTKSNSWFDKNYTCRNPTIVSFNPRYGLREGETIVNIQGINLGQTIEMVNNITVAGSLCIPLKNSSYHPPTAIACQVNQTNRLQTDVHEGPIVVQIGKFVAYSAQPFAFVDPKINNIFPKEGPQSGGTKLILQGDYLNVGNLTQVSISGIPCKVLERNSSIIKCITTASNKTLDGNVLVEFDTSKKVYDYHGIQFSYKSDPVLGNFIYDDRDSNKAPKGIQAGGLSFYISGQNLLMIQNPIFYIYNENQTQLYNGQCKALNINGSDLLKCDTPSIPDFESSSISPNNPVTFDFGFKMDGVASVQNISKKKPNLYKKFHLYPNPTFHVKSYSANDEYLLISGENINLVCRENDIAVKIIHLKNESECRLESISMVHLKCRLPRLDDSAKRLEVDSDTPEVIVHIGQNFKQNVGKLMYLPRSPKTTNPTTLLYIGITFAVLILFIFIIFFSIYCKNIFRKTQFVKENRRLLDELHLKVARVCKEAFTELQTEISDLTTNYTFTGIPFLDYRTYTQNIMFPNILDHSTIQAENTEIFGKEEALQLFSQLVANKRFLLLFIKTLESSENFSMNDRIHVASLIMMTLQNDMGYCTNILRTLLIELIEKYMQGKSHPKLLLRRSESVVEKMISIWFTFLLHGFIKEYAGKPLYLLFRAIKQQINKGPVDAITHEARYSLNENTLIRRDIDYQMLTIFVNVPEQTAVITGLESNVEKAPVKVLSCDTISQMKEKAMDVIYSNIRYSQRPTASELEIEWLIDDLITKVLSDDDSSSKLEGEWKQLNTLQHYTIPDGSVFNLMSVRRRSMYDASELNSTIKTTTSRRPSINSWKSAIFRSIKRKSVKSSQMSTHTSQMNHRLWHLVKPYDESYNADNCRTPIRNDTMVSEIYLVRLLSTKGILQKFVDDLFESIYSTSVPDNELLLAVKYMFDFLDDQASRYGITDPDVVHAWKSNCLPLRFWVNLIKNPNFIFDIHKSNTVDSCLSVIAQAFMDSCSTSDLHLSENSSTTKLLYAKDIPANKERVKQYYGVIKSWPTVSDQDMNAMLNEESRMHSCEFNTKSSLHALYKYAVKYNDQLTNSLKEDEFSRNNRLIQKLEKVHCLMAKDLE